MRLLKWLFSLVMAYAKDKTVAELVTQVVNIYDQVRDAENSGHVEVSRSLQPDLHKALTNAVITYRVQQRQWRSHP